MIELNDEIILIIEDNKTIYKVKDIWEEKKNGYWFSSCINCGQMPTVEDTDLCGPCCFGETDSMWDWLWKDWMRSG